MKAKSNSTMEFHVFMELSESEARALKALTEYGTEAFLEVFYQKLGSAALLPYETGLISLFESVKNILPKHLNRIDKTRETFKNETP